MRQILRGVSGYIESLRRERDRFVAFAFCAANLLLEIDVNQTVKFLASATQSLVEISRHEARKQHELLLSELREQIRSGTFTADLDVVAERVAEVLADG